MKIKEFYNKFSYRFASVLAKILSSMTLFYILNILIIISVILQHPTNVEGWLLVAVSVYFQGVALPVLSFVSNFQGDRLEKKVDETLSILMDELNELRKIHEIVLDELKELKEVKEEVYSEKKEINSLKHTKKRKS